MVNSTIFLVHLCLKISLMGLQLGEEGTLKISKPQYSTNVSTSDNILLLPPTPLLPNRF